MGLFSNNDFEYDDKAETHQFVKILLFMLAIALGFVGAYFIVLDLVNSFGYLWPSGLACVVYSLALFTFIIAKGYESKKTIAGIIISFLGVCLNLLYSVLSVAFGEASTIFLILGVAVMFIGAFFVNPIIAIAHFMDVLLDLISNFRRKRK